LGLPHLPQETHHFRGRGRGRSFLLRRR
jgi:hypothetical protein